MLRTEYMSKKLKPRSGTTLRICGHKDFLMEDTIQLKETALKIEKNRKRRYNIAMICSDKEKMIVSEWVKLDSFVIRKLIFF